MKIKSLFGAALIATLVLTSCSTDEKQDPDTNGRTLALREKNSGLHELQQKALEGLEQRFTFKADREIASFTSKSGVEININPSKLTINGQPVHGELTVSYIEIFGRASMVTANKATMGIAENNEEGAVPLQSGAEIFLNITQEGQNVDEGSPYQVIVPAELTGGPDDEMILWQGETDEDGDITWVKDINEDGSEKDVPIEDGKYVLDLSTFGWCNIDKIPNTTGQLTRLFVKVPSGYDDQNSKVYLAYQGAQNLLAQLDMYDNVNELFYEHGEYIPVGTVCHIIFVSGSAGNWQIAVLPETIGINGTVIINPSDINPATQNDVDNIISSLP